MFVKFRNAEVPIYKLRKGTIVELDSQYFYIKSVRNSADGILRLRLESEFEEWTGLPKFVTWLEV